MVMVINQMTSMMQTTKAFKIFFIVDLIVVLFCLLSGHTDWLVNTQIAFISSLLVTIGSYLGYKSNVQKRVGDYTLNSEQSDYDEVDQMDDKYDLYSPDTITTTVSEPTTQEIKEAMKPIKQNHMKNLKSGFSGMSSFYRLIGYVFLILGFFYLNNNNLLHVYSYVFGFIIVPVSSLIFSLNLKYNK